MVSRKVYLKRKREILHQVITKLEKELARVNRELKQLERGVEVMEAAPEVREDIRAELAAKVEGKDSQKSRILKFTLLGIGAGIAVGLIMLAFPGFYDTLVQIHQALSKPRYSFYVLLGSILFVEFMRATWVESAKARSKRLIPLTS
ncbi:hypothetical protein [Thermococcus sp. JCM 11816]|uniref:hypothetical protein n=1 Tax=Thermococcus sp. (strain JCM 11816 / KS-1) TaxID=1295125 RepID=UPI0006D163DB